MMQDLTTWFAFPMLLGLLAVLPVLAILMLYARRQRRRACALFGDAGALQRLQSTSVWPRRWRNLCLFIGLALVVVAAAGPRWGKVAAPVARPLARPLVIVLDMSRSMLAEQPSRQDLARRALRDLATTLTERGGPRLALVIFAAHGQLAMPLTGDYDHLVDLLRDIDADDLPPALRPRGGDDGSSSGTRIGEALRLALHAMDTESGGDILLLSDGDDPGGDDEWLQGADEARRHHVAVHTIGIGNPRVAATIPFGNGVLEYKGQPVRTRLHEKPLQEIARRTHGVYVPAFTDNLPLGKLLPSILADRPTDEPAESEASLPIWQPRYRWFLTPALLLLAIPLLGSKRSAPDVRRVYEAPFAKVLLLPLLFVLVSAAPLPGVDALLRQGNEAFEALRTKEALDWFEKAEDSAADPGLVAFNEAAALYRLQQYADAALHYQRCLEDNTIPAGRRAWAHFQTGNAYAQESHAVDRGLLEKALAAYRACLLMEETLLEMRGDARHNLELVRMLWLKTLPNPDELPRNDEPPPRPKSKNASQHPKSKKDDQRPGAPASASDEQGSEDGSDQGKPDSVGKSNKTSSGPLTVLPDSSELVSLSPKDTQAHLEDVAQRIARERRHYRRHAVLVPDNVKDW